jgi:hypothetical protein
LLGGDAPEAHALIGKKHRGAGQEKLAELEDRIEPPALKKQDAAAEKAHGGEENVIVAGQRRFKTPHEVEEGAAYGQHDADNAGPIQAGVDQGGTRAQIESTLGNIPAFPLPGLLKPLRSRPPDQVPGSEAAIHPVVLADEEESQGNRHHHDHSTPEQAAQEIRQGGSHGGKRISLGWILGRVREFLGFSPPRFEFL